MLDTNIWQKWVHSHRIGLVLEQDLPLPRYLHVPNSSGRFNILQCRQALASLTQLLKHWATFVLAENHSYIKFLSRSVPGLNSFHTAMVGAKPFTNTAAKLMGSLLESIRQAEGKGF